jgi:hypothetical protein
LPGFTGGSAGGVRLLIGACFPQTNFTAKIDGELCADAFPTVSRPIDIPTNIANKIAFRINRPPFMRTESENLD